MTNVDRRNNQQQQLQIDNVLSTQPELGPSIPDGGYGWVVLLATLFFQLLIPSLIVGYGVFLVFLRLENSSPAYPELWDNPMIYAPLFFVATWTLVDPWSRSIIYNSIWPRLVATAATSLTCSGLLFIWMAISNGTRTAPWFVTSGILSGLGASIVLTQCDVILSQYFRIKLKHVKTLTQVTVSIGFVITPIVLGNCILKNGLLSIILWYQIIILQGLVVCLLLRKPPYLKGTGKKYKLVHGVADDEIDIFAKNTTELQNTRHSLSTIEQTEVTIEHAAADKHQDISDTGASGMSNGGTNLTHSTVESKKQKDRGNLIDVEIHPAMNSKQQWEIFDGGETQNNDAMPALQKSLSSETAANNDFERIDTFEDNFVQVPKPLFTETHINNNNTYSYDNGEPSEEPVVFMPVNNNSTRKNNFIRFISLIKEPTFYKSLLQITTLKFSIFTFFALFPSHLYMRITTIKVHHTTYMVGYISISGIFFALMLAFVNSNTYRRALFLWIFSWCSSLGFIMMSDVKSESVLVIGAILVIGSIQSLEYFGASLQLTGRGDRNRINSVLHVISALMFLIFFIIDMSYVNCFRMMALLHFIMGGIWFANYLFKQIKPVVSSASVIDN